MKQVKFTFAKHNIYAGIYRHAIKGIFGVKLAAEMQSPCRLSIPIQDYSVPTLEQTMLLFDVIKTSKEEPIYIGCMGGLGRTGLILALLTKIDSYIYEEKLAIVLLKINTRLGAWYCNKYVESYVQGVDAVHKIRDVYNPNAVETSEQFAFVAEYNVLPVLIKLIKYKVI